MRKKTLPVSSTPNSKEKHFTSEVPLPVYPTSPRKSFNPISSVLPQVDCMIKVLQIIEKFYVNNVLKNLEKFRRKGSDAWIKLRANWHNKDNQIDILFSEITSKNKEIEKLRKSNAVFVQKQKNHDNIINYEKELKDCISVLDVKKQEIKELEEIKHELEIENRKIQRKLDDCFLIPRERNPCHKERSSIS